MVSADETVVFKWEVVSQNEVPKVKGLLDIEVSTNLLGVFDDNLGVGDVGDRE